jgi:hypothetical protein
MNRKISFLLLGLLIAASGFAASGPRPQASRAAAPAPTYDEIAALLAGLPGDVPALAGVRASALWKQYAESVEKSWADMTVKRLGPMRVWADKELLRARASSKFLFYPFGGPDFLTAFEFFPESEAYFLMGLEFCGRLPRPDLWKDRQAEAYLKNFTASLSDFFDKSYFITSHMDGTLYGQGQVEGVMPLLAFFLKRTGHRILDIGRMDFDAKGQTVELEYDKQKKASRPYGLKILFAAEGSARVKSITYVSCNLENKTFAKDSSLQRHLGRLPAGLTTYVKSASYLMHYATFTNIREIVLDKSRFILEDDTGIPYKVFKPKDWRVTLYGEYAKPVKDFSGVDQPDLKKAFEEGADLIPKLPYHLGYHWRDNRDALLLAEKKK